MPEAGGGRNGAPGGRTLANGAEMGLWNWAAAGEWRRDGVMELGSGWRTGPRAGFDSGGGGLRC